MVHDVIDTLFHLVFPYRVAIDLDKDYFKDSDKFKNVKIEYAERRLREFVNLYNKLRDRTLKNAEHGISYSLTITEDGKLTFLLMDVLGYLITFKVLKPIQRKKLVAIYNKLFNATEMRGFFEKEWVKSKPKILEMANHLLNIWLNSENRDLSSNGQDFIKIGKVHLFFSDSSLTPQDKENLIRIVEEAGKIMASSKVPHFANAFYGNIFVISHNKMHDHFAYYYRSTDMVYLNSSLLKKTSIKDGIRVVIHELGHRYYAKVLNIKEKEAWETYYSELISRPYDASLAPKVGDSVYLEVGLSYMFDSEPGEDKITRIELDSTGLVHTYYFEVDGVSYYFTDADLSKLGYFPTAYSKENPEEFFCETISYYSMGMVRTSIRSILEKEFENHFMPPPIEKGKEKAKKK